MSLDYHNLTKIFVSKNQITDETLENLKKKLNVPDVINFDLDKPPAAMTLDLLFTLYTSSLDISNILEKLDEKHFVGLILDDGEYIFDKSVKLRGLKINSFSESKPIVRFENNISMECTYLELSNLKLDLNGSDGLNTSIKHNHLSISNCVFNGTKEKVMSRISVLNITKGSKTCDIFDNEFDNCSMNFEQCDTIMFSGNKVNAGRINLGCSNSTFHKNVLSDDLKINFFNCPMVHMNSNKFENLIAEYSNIDADHNTTLFITNNIINFSGKQLLDIFRCSKCFMNNNFIMFTHEEQVMPESDISSITTNNDKLLAKVYFEGELELTNNIFSQNEIEIACSSDSSVKSAQNKFKEEISSEYLDVKFIISDRNIIKATRKVITSGW